MLRVFDSLTVYREWAGPLHIDPDGLDRVLVFDKYLCQLKLTSHIQSGVHEFQLDM